MAAAVVELQRHRDTASDDMVAVLAHLCLNALAGMHVAFETLSDDRLDLRDGDRNELVADVLAAIDRMESLARCLMRGMPVTPTVEVGSRGLSGDR